MFQRKSVPEEIFPLAHFWLVIKEPLKYCTLPHWPPHLPDGFCQFLNLLIYNFLYEKLTVRYTPACTGRHFALPIKPHGADRVFFYRTFQLVQLFNVFRNAIGGLGLLCGLPLCKRGIYCRSGGVVERVHNYMLLSF